MEQKNTFQPDTYRIQVRETINKKVFSWLEDLSITPVENNGTFLTTSFADQSALRGFLEQLWNLNITVISVERIENEK
jgi:hypothetical protein